MGWFSDSFSVTKFESREIAGGTAICERTVYSTVPLNAGPTTTAEFGDVSLDVAMMRLTKMTDVDRLTAGACCGAATEILP